jgi:hypothetical protein
MGVIEAMELWLDLMAQVSLPINNAYNEMGISGFWLDLVYYTCYISPFGALLSPTSFLGGGTIALTG